MILIFLMDRAVSGRGDDSRSRPEAGHKRPEGDKPSPVDSAGKDQAKKFKRRTDDKFTLFYPTGSRPNKPFVGAFNVKYSKVSPPQVASSKEGVINDIRYVKQDRVYNVANGIRLGQRQPGNQKVTLGYKVEKSPVKDEASALTQLIAKRLSHESRLSSTENYGILMGIYRRIAEVIPECSGDEVSYLYKMVFRLEKVIRHVTTQKTHDRRVVHYFSVGQAVVGQAICVEAKTILEHFQRKSKSHATNLFNTLISDLMRLKTSWKQHPYIDNNVEWVVKQRKPDDEELAKHDYLRKKDGLVYEDQYSRHTSPKVEGKAGVIRTTVSSMHEYLVKQSESIIATLEGPSKTHRGFTLISHVISIFSEIKVWASTYPESVPKDAKFYKRLVEATVNWVHSSPFVTHSDSQGKFKIVYFKSHIATFDALIDAISEFVNDYQANVEPLLPVRNHFFLRKRLRLLAVQLSEHQLTLGIHDDCRLEFESEEDRLFFMRGWTMDHQTKVLKREANLRAFLHPREPLKKDRLESGRVYTYRFAKEKQQVVFIEFYKAFQTNLNLHLIKHAKPLAKRGLDHHTRQLFVGVREQVVLRGKYSRGTKVVGLLSLPETAMRTLWKGLHMVEAVTTDLLNDEHFKGDRKLLENLSRSTLLFIDWTKGMFFDGKSFYEFNPREKISEYFPECKVAEDRHGFVCGTTERGRKALLKEHQSVKEWMHKRVSLKDPLVKTRLFQRAFKIWRTSEPVLKNQKLPRNRLIPISRIIKEMPAVLNSQKTMRRRTGTKEAYSTVDLKKVSTVFKRTAEYLNTIFPDLDYQNTGESEADDKNLEELDEELSKMLGELKGAKQTDRVVVFDAESGLEEEVNLEKEDLEWRALDANELLTTAQKSEDDEFDEHPQDLKEEVIEWSSEGEEDEAGEAVVEDGQSGEWQDDGRQGEEDEGLVAEDNEDEEEEESATQKFINLKPESLKPNKRPRTKSDSQSPAKEENDKHGLEDSPKELKDFDEDLDLIEDLPEELSGFKRKEDEEPEEEDIEPRKKRGSPKGDKKDEFSIKLIPTDQPDEEEDEPLPVGKFTHLKPEQLKPKRRTKGRSESESPIEDGRRRVRFDDNVRVIDIPSSEDDGEIGESQIGKESSPKNRKPSPKRHDEDSDNTPSGQQDNHAIDDPYKVQTDVRPSTNESPKKEGGSHSNWGNALFLPSDPLWQEDILNPTTEDPSIRRHINTIARNWDDFRDSEDEEPVDSEMIKGESTNGHLPKLNFSEDVIDQSEHPEESKPVKKDDKKQPKPRRNFGHNSISLDNVSDDEESPRIKRNIEGNTLDLNRFSDIDHSEHPEEFKPVKKDDKKQPKFRRNIGYNNLLNLDNVSDDESDSFEELQSVAKKDHKEPSEDDDEYLDKLRMRHHRPEKPSQKPSKPENRFKPKLPLSVQPRASIKNPNDFLVKENPIDSETEERESKDQEEPSTGDKDSQRHEGAKEEPRQIVSDEKWPTQSQIDRLESLRNRVPKKSLFYNGKSTDKKVDELTNRLKRVGKELHTDMLSDEESDEDEPMDEQTAELDLEMKLLQLNQLLKEPAQVDALGKEKLIREIQQAKNQLQRLRRAKQNKHEDEKHPSKYPRTEGVLDKSGVPKKSGFFVDRSHKTKEVPSSPLSELKGHNSELDISYPEAIKRLGSLKSTPGKSRFFYQAQELKKLADVDDESIKEREEQDEVDPNGLSSLDQSQPENNRVIDPLNPSDETQAVGKTGVVVAGEPRKRRVIHRVVFVVSECAKCVENQILRRHFAALKIQMD